MPKNKKAWSSWNSSVNKNNTSEKQDLSAKVLKAIVESQPSKIDIINEEILSLIHI